MFASTSRIAREVNCFTQQKGVQTCYNTHLACIATQPRIGTCLLAFFLGQCTKRACPHSHRDSWHVKNIRNYRHGFPGKSNCCRWSCHNTGSQKKGWFRASDGVSLPRRAKFRDLMRRLAKSFPSPNWRSNSVKSHRWAIALL